MAFPMQAIGAIVQTAIGTGQLIAGAVKNKQAEKAFPKDLMDSAIQNRIYELDRKRQSLEFMGGTKYNTMKNILDESLASVSRGIVESGGSSGTTVAGLSRLKASNQLNEILAQHQDFLMPYITEVDKLMEYQSRRRTQLQLARYSQKKATATGLINAGMQNITAPAANIAGSENPNLTGEQQTSGGGGSGMGLDSFMKMGGAGGGAGGGVGGGGGGGFTPDYGGFGAGGAVS